MKKTLTITGVIALLIPIAYAAYMAFGAGFIVFLILLLVYIIDEHLKK